MVSVDRLIFGQLLVLLVEGGYPWLEQISRQELLVRGCGRVRAPDYARLDHVLVDHGHKLLYCYVPKVACTNWKRVLMLLTGAATSLGDIPGSLAHADNSTLRLTQLPPHEIRRCLREYTAFVMVRHPFERLLSAYRNKFENTYSSYFQLRYGRDIIRKYRVNATSADLDTGVGVTFREFVHYILDGGGADNEHWTSVYELCQPCALNYTFVGRYETLAEDATALLDLIGAVSVAFPSTKPANTSHKLRNYLQQLSMREIQGLYEMYEHDFRLFGYTLEDLLGFDLP